jgi:hypothetical protein
MRVWTVAAALVVSCLLVSSCGGSERDEPGPPIGRAVLPDLVPAPPVLVHLRRTKGRWSLAFDSVLVNVGHGEFLLRANRDEEDRWHVEQDIPHSESGAEVVQTDATLVWGGDGHDHWHVSRVASNRLVRLDADGNPTGRAWTDFKVGFCFYDHSRRLEKGPDEAVHSHESCGDEDDHTIGMGLSPGWADVYKWVLPGQSIDITRIPDGKYRLWAEADERGWFREVTRENNVTWVDLDLQTRADELRTALVVDVGPQPR